VTESLSKGVIDGAMVPWEAAPALKLQDVTKYHLDTAPGVPKMSNSIFVIAMNPAKYDSLPPDLKKVIDANTGLEWSKQIGKIFDGTTVVGQKLAREANGVFDTLSAANTKMGQGDGGCRQGVDRAKSMLKAPTVRRCSTTKAMIKRTADKSGIGADGRSTA
jgi:multimeric flavodoxin WrbA